MQAEYRNTYRLQKMCIVTPLLFGYATLKTNQNHMFFFFGLSFEQSHIISVSFLLFLREGPRTRIVENTRKIHKIKIKKGI